MKTQRSRDTFDAARRYSSVYQQQGRMLTDADWNELADVVKGRLDDVLRDVVVGGTPRERGLIRITTAADGTKSYALQWGYAYVDGIMAQAMPKAGTVPEPLGKDFNYTIQADFPAAPALPAGNHLLYLDVWERPVLFFEDSALRDPGLHGADTCTRTQTMIQVKWCELGVDPENPGINPPIGTAPVTLTLRQGSTEPDPCDPCSDELELHDRVGNYLFRIEVHSVEYDATGAPARVVLKWSSENGAEHYEVGQEPAGFIKEGWVYEFFSGAASDFASEKHPGRHLATTAGWNPVSGVIEHTYPEVVPAGFPWVRRWDGAGEFVKSAGSWDLAPGATGTDRGVALSTTSSSEAPGHVTSGSDLLLQLDAMVLKVGLGSHAVLAGDFWHVAVRENTHRSGDVLLDAVPPSGIRHHYLTLGSVTGGVFTPDRDALCQRFGFPPLTDIRADDVCYDNEVCQMPGVETVKDALDALCRRKDLRWHNKHLHGWGVVCGLQLHCAPRLVTGETNNELNLRRRREIRVRPGYALDCEGQDIVLDETLALDLVGMIQALDAGSADPILKDGSGTATVWVELDSEAGKPTIKVGKYDKKSGDLSSLFEGTLLFDFYENCIVDLLEALKKEIDLTPPPEDSTEPHVSVQRRRLVALLHLALQFADTSHGRYILTTRQEHELLSGLYDQLRNLLQSKTFCAMFAGSEFPEYPFRESGFTAFFGKNEHTHLLMHPSGKFLVSYGGTNRLINVYDVERGELVRVVEMPSSEGAEIRALVFSKDGKELYAAANVRNQDTLLGMADVEDRKLTWRKSVVLCDILIAEMVPSPTDPGLIYATALGAGFFDLRPSVLFDLEKPRPAPRYSFNSVGQFVLNAAGTMAVATAAGAGAGTATYDRLVVLDLTVLPPVGGTSLPPTQVQALSFDGIPANGDDDLELGPVSGAEHLVYVMVRPTTGTTIKRLLTYRLTRSGTVGNPVGLGLQDTPTCLHFEAKSGRLLVGQEATFRLLAVSPDGNRVVVGRIPVHVQPKVIISDPSHENIYVLNYLSNTVVRIPVGELDVTAEFLDRLAAYRRDVIMAFVSLFGGLLQYLKDCFCDHLLVHCPKCKDGDTVKLGAVEIRENQIHHICNFAGRKDVHTFPKVEYWLSLIPILPLVKKAVEKLCCLVLPRLFEKYEQAVGRRLEITRLDEDASRKATYPAHQVTRGVQTYQRADIKGEVTDLRRRAGILSVLAKDSALLKAQDSSINKGGIRKSALTDATVEAAKSELTEQGYEVASVKTYDPASAGKLQEFQRTPGRIPKGAKVNLYEKDGKVLFYTLVETPTGNVTIPGELRAELSELERRKTALSDLEAVRADLSRIEARRESVANVEGVKTELEALKSERVRVERDLSALREEIAVSNSELKAMSQNRDQLLADFTRLKAERDSVTESLTAAERERQLAATRLAELRSSLKEIEDVQSRLTIELGRIRPITDVPGIDPALRTHLEGLGIRTVEELSKADPRTITKTGVLTGVKAKELISNAAARLRPQ